MGEELAVERLPESTLVQAVKGAAADLGMLVDMAYGVLWYRMLVGHAPLDDGAVRDLAGHLLAAGQAGRADRSSRGNSAAN